MKRATLMDISEMTGLSVSTVSRILRGESNSSADNIERTITVAQEINYPLNHSILKGVYGVSKQLRVALVTSFQPDEFYSSFYYGFYETSKSENVSLSLHTFQPDESDLSRFIKELNTLSVDAAVLFLPSLQEQDYLTLIENIPKHMILISVAPSFHPILDTITFDSYRGGHIIARHFHKKGYLKVGVVTGPSSRNESLLRKNGFYDYVNQHHDMEIIFSYEGDYSFESGQKAFLAFNELKEKPSAVFLSNDYMCIGFLQYAQIHKIKIPQSVAIAGYDDLPLCTYVHPTITTIHTDYSLLAKKTYKMLKEKTLPGNAHNGMLSVIPVKLCERNSS